MGVGRSSTEGAFEVVVRVLVPAHEFNDRQLWSILHRINDLGDDYIEPRRSVFASAEQYAEAYRLFTTTDLIVREIAKRVGIKGPTLQAHIQRHKWSRHATQAATG